MTISLLVLGLGAGVFSGMFGIGGGVIIVPVLIVFLGFGPVEAVATSLAALLLPVGILAVIAYYRNKLIDLQASALIAVGLLTTTIFGAQIALNLPSDTLKQIYGVFLLFVSWRFIQPRIMWAAYQARRQAAAAVEASAAEETSADPEAAAAARSDVPWWVVLLVGLGAGVASGMFGIGGGAVIVPALVALLHYDQKLAVGTSLGALLLPVGLPGVIVYVNEGVLNVADAAPVAVGLLLGALVGARIALGLPSKTVKRLYGFFLLAVGLWFIIEPILNVA